MSVQFQLCQRPPLGSRTRWRQERRSIHKSGAFPLFLVPEDVFFSKTIPSMKYEMGLDGRRGVDVAVAVFGFLVAWGRDRSCPCTTSSLVTGGRSSDWSRPVTSRSSTSHCLSLCSGACTRSRGNQPSLCKAPVRSIYMVPRSGISRDLYVDIEISPQTWALGCMFHADGVEMYRCRIKFVKRRYRWREESTL